ncbi:hypothetical protein FVE85_5938 [Porphyridium purpureum]|uniref:Uncharacterized protein n=1 Tax=Porphyridium purpureum TaxID=35688 RepID=A0A5J4Z691_PORPP|nr:hypothetical protein FVE85_5938 [Porphyridium purpureum]|eukprot:POR8771..scf295_1
MSMAASLRERSSRAAALARQLQSVEVERFWSSESDEGSEAPDDEHDRTRHDAPRASHAELKMLRQARRAAYEEIDERMRDSAAILVQRQAALDELNALRAEHIAPLQESRELMERARRRQEEVDRTQRRLDEREAQLTRREAQVREASRTWDALGVLGTDVLAFVQAARSVRRALDVVEQERDIVLHPDSDRQTSLTMQIDSDLDVRAMQNLLRELNPNELTARMERVSSSIEQNWAAARLARHQAEQQSAQLDAEKAALDAQKSVLETHASSVDMIKQSLLEHKQNLAELRLSLEDQESGLQKRLKQARLREERLAAQEVQGERLREELEGRESVVSETAHEVEASRKLIREREARLRQEEMGVIRRKTELDTLELELARSRQALERRWMDLRTKENEFEEEVVLLRAERQRFVSEQNDASAHIQEGILRLREDRRAQENNQIGTARARETSIDPVAPSSTRGQQQRTVPSATHVENSHVSNAPQVQLGTKPATETAGHKVEQGGFGFLHQEIQSDISRTSPNMGTSAAAGRDRAGDGRGSVQEQVSSEKRDLVRTGPESSTVMRAASLSSRAGYASSAGSDSGSLFSNSAILESDEEMSATGKRIRRDLLQLQIQDLQVSIEIAEAQKFAMIQSGASGANRRNQADVRNTVGPLDDEIAKYRRQVVQAKAELDRLSQR